jgi:hypothetical protein
MQRHYLNFVKGCQRGGWRPNCVKESDAQPNSAQERFIRMSASHSGWSIITSWCELSTT